MWVLAIGGFGPGLVSQLSAGGWSSIPLVVHAHAIVYFGWLALFSYQVSLSAAGRTDRHRRLGKYLVGYAGKGWGPGDYKKLGWEHNPAGPKFGGGDKGTGAEGEEYFSGSWRVEPAGETYFVQGWVQMEAHTFRFLLSNLDDFQPEMAVEKDSVDARADIYALGGVAYWLLTGKYVFDADNGLAMIVEHVKTQPKAPSERAEKAIPRELDESAAMDGCGYTRFVWSILIPLIRPAIATVTVIHAIGIWNELILANVYLTNDDAIGVALQRCKHVSLYLLDRVRRKQGPYSVDLAGFLLFLIVAWSTISLPPAKSRPSVPSPAIVSTVTV